MGNTKETIKYIGIWLFIFIVGSLIVSAILSPGTATSLKNRVVDSMEDVMDNVDIESFSSVSTENKKDPLISSCEETYRRYSKIGESKYDGLRFSLIESSIVNSDEEAKEFHDLYSSAFDGGYLAAKSLYGIDFDFPVAFLAIKMSGTGGSVPVVIMCDSNGELVGPSKTYLTLS